MKTKSNTHPFKNSRKDMILKHMTHWLTVTYDLPAQGNYRNNDEGGYKKHSNCKSNYQTNFMVAFRMANLDNHCKSREKKFNIISNRTSNQFAFIAVHKVL